MSRRLSAALLLMSVAISLLAVSGCPKPEPGVTPPTTPPLLRPPPGAEPKPPAANTETGAKAEAITVFAGAASKPALEQLARVYQQKTGTKVDINFGGSGAVLTQFTQEQYGDVYVPGSDDFMDRAEQKDAVLKDSRTALVYLVPTICVAKGNPKHIKGLEDLSQAGLRVVIGDTKAVCLGAIAQEMLQRVKLWETVQKRVASYASNCEDVLNSLLLGESDAVIGWDAWPRQYPERVEGIALPRELARTRNLPAAVIKWSKQPEEARAFIEFLTGGEAKQSFGEHGYTLTQ